MSLRWLDLLVLTSPVSCGSASSESAGLDAAFVDASAMTGEGSAPIVRESGSAEAAPSADASSTDTSPEVDGSRAAEAGQGADAVATYTMNVTFYGWDDNSPVGNAIAYPNREGFPTVHSVAGGTGSYSDPLTMATDSAELAVGTRVYLSYAQKYAVMEDDCAECDADWSTSGVRHIDVWMNSDGTESAIALLACESQWTNPSASVRADPPENLSVNLSPLFTPATNTCAAVP